MKAFKCDICKEYCDDVFKVDGLSEPKTHIIGRFGINLDCCVECYDKICKFVGDNIVDDNNKTIKGV